MLSACCVHYKHSAHLHVLLYANRYVLQYAHHCMHVHFQILRSPVDLVNSPVVYLSIACQHHVVESLDNSRVSKLSSS